MCAKPVKLSENLEKPEGNTKGKGKGQYKESNNQGKGTSLSLCSDEIVCERRDRNALGRLRLDYRWG